VDLAPVGQSFKQRRFSCSILTHEKGNRKRKHKLAGFLEDRKIERIVIGRRVLLRKEDNTIQMHGIDPESWPTIAGLTRTAVGYERSKIRDSSDGAVERTNLLHNIRLLLRGDLWEDRKGQNLLRGLLGYGKIPLFVT
jgi:hypothetical protein